MLDLNISKAVESFFIGTVQQAKRIPEAKRRLGTKDIFEVRGGNSAGLDGLLGRSESSGRGNEGGKDGGLHFDFQRCTRTNCENGKNPKSKE